MHCTECVVGIDLGGTNMRLALADMFGKVVAKKSTSTVGIRDAGVIVRMICEAVENMLEEGGLLKESLKAIAVGVPGITDVENGVVIATSYLMGWRDVPLRALLERSLNVPVAVDNDVNMAALGESRVGIGRGVRNFVFMAIGTGVGAGIVLNGALHRGNRWTAGEIGYMLVPGTSEETVTGESPGGLEEIAGGEGIKKQWRNRWGVSRTTLKQGAVASEIFDSAVRGDALASEVLELAAKTLAYAIYNVWLILNCELFVLGGSVGLHPALGEATKRLLSARVQGFELALETSSLGKDAQLIGAIFMALDTADPGWVAGEPIESSSSH